MNRVLVWTFPRELRAGGGPAGYGFNLREAMGARHPVSDELEILVAASGSGQRYSETAGVRNISGARWLWQAAYAWTLRRSVSARRWDRRPRAAEEECALIESAAVVVLSGFQSSRMMKFIRSRSDALVVYMPHSPTPAAHEFAMYAELSGHRLARRVTEYFLREEGALLNSADAVVFPSAGAGQEYRKAFCRPNGNWRVIHIASGVPDIAQSTALQDFGPVRRFVFLGRYVDHKGYDLFVEASQAYRGADAEFVSIGEGPLEPGPVKDLGWHVKPHSLLRRGDVVVVPNRSAYFDLLPLECASLGLPLVMTPVGGNLDQHRLLPDSLLAEDASVLGLVQALEIAVAMPQDWGRRNRAAYEAHFTLQAFAASWVQAMKELLGPPEETEELSLSHDS